MAEVWPTLIDPCLLFLSFGRAAVRWEEDTGTQKELPSMGSEGRTERAALEAPWGCGDRAARRR